MKYRLRAFGGLVVERDGVRLDGVAGHRKALSLLAALAVHGSLGRERLMALLWPESDEARAKGSLKQAVHLLRRQLAEPALLLGTSELRLNPDRIESDVQLFIGALEAGDAEAAVAFYGGPFLDGVHLEGTPEFERWTDERRAELAGRYARALEDLALGAEALGDAQGAAGWWRRLQAADPFNGRVALQLIRALDAVGDRAAALRHAHAHDVLLREELGIPADPAILELAERFRSVAAPGPAGSPAADAHGRTFPPPSVAPAQAASSPSARSPADASSPAPHMAASAAPAVEPAPAAAAAGPLPAAGRRLRLGLRLAGAIVMVALAGGVVVVAIAGQRLAGDAVGDGGAGVARGGGVSLVVLPFVDISPEGDQEYFSDGITEEILNSLAGITGLRVPARSTSFYFKGRNLPVTEIAAQLGVDAVLEGSVRRSGDRVRITAQLIDGRADRHLWSETFDRDLGDVFAVQTEIAGIVAEAMRVRLIVPGEVGGPPPTLSAEAHDLYLRGLFHWNRRSAADLGLAVGFFEEATRVDPAYARAWAGMALAYAVIPIAFTSLLPQEEAWARMDAAAARALALDPTRAEAHAARAVSYHFQWRLEDAEREYRRALAIDPDYATAHQWYGEHLAKTGRGEEGVGAVRRAIELDPFSLVAHNDLGLVLMLKRQFPEAIAQWERTVALDPGFAIPLFFLHRVHLLEGRLDAAEDAGRRWAELTGAMTPDAVVTLSRAPGDREARRDALALLREGELVPTPRWLDLAFYYVVLGELDAAIHALEQGLNARAPMMVQVGMAPWFDALRGDERMARIRREVGFR
jgi:TolB-like protein/DNA-binding SARP family transcriptional activator/Tfp pilus assembly protein PilF